MKITASFVLRYSLIIIRCSFPVFLLLASLNGCATLPDKDKGFTAPEAQIGNNSPDKGRLNFFLTLKDDQGPSIRMEMSAIEILAGDQRLPIAQKSLIINSAAIGKGQLFLGSIEVPPGRYSRMRFIVSKGEFQKPDGNYVSITKEPLSIDIQLASALNLEPGDSGSLLINWDVENSLESNNTLAPALSAAPSARQLLRDLIFVACPDIDTIFIVRADKNWVVDSFGLKGGPTYLAINPDTSLQRLYALASRERSVKVIDLSSYRVIDFFSIQLNDEPNFMTINPDGQSVYLLDERSGYLSHMDLNTGHNIARVQLGYRPKYAAYLKQQNLLAVSLSLSQKVLLLDPVNLEIIGTISTGSAPEGLLISENQLLIAEYGGNTISLVDLASSTNKDRLTVGFGPRRLLETDSQIYVSNYFDGSLSVLVPGQIGVFQEIYGLGRPLEMVFDQTYFQLYVTDEETGALAVIDVNTNQISAHITLGAKPYGLVMIQ